MLNTYAQCLKHLKKEEEFVRISLKILAKVNRGRSDFASLSPDSSTRKQESTQILGDLENDLGTITTISKSLNVEVSASLNDYFSDIHLDRCIQHFSDQDGFELHLNLRSLSPSDILFRSVRVRVVSADQQSEIWLFAKDQLISPGKAKISLMARVSPHRTIYDCDKD